MTEWGGVQNKKNRTKNWALWNTIRRGTGRGRMARTVDREGPRGEVWLKPIKRCARDAKPRRQAVKKDVVVNGIKGSRQIKKTEAGSLLWANSCDKVVEKRKKYSLSRMVLSVGRLKWTEEWIWSEVSSEPRLDNAFSKFGEKREIRDGTIVGQIFFVKGRKEGSKWVR